MHIALIDTEILWGYSSKVEHVTVNHQVWVRFPLSPLRKHNEKKYGILSLKKHVRAGSTPAIVELVAD